MSEAIYEELFKAGALSPSAWALTGHRLQHAADILFDLSRQELKAHSQTGSPISADNLSLVMPATLLYALAVENSLKALAIQQDGGRLQGLRLRKWPADGHDLPRLAELVRFTLTKTEADLLQRFSEFIRWAGRYPVPLRAEDMALEQIPAMGKLPPLPLEDEAERAVASHLVEKLQQLVAAGTGSA